MSPPLPPSPRKVQPPAGAERRHGRPAGAPRGARGAPRLTSAPGAVPGHSGRPPVPWRARLPRSAGLGAARLGGAPRVAIGCGGRGGAPPLSGSSRRTLPGPARLQQAAAAAAERAAAGRAGRAGRAAGHPRRAPTPPPRRRRQDDRRQQHQQQRGAHAVPLHVLGALRAQLPRRGDLLLRLAPALPHPQAGALHRPGGEPPPEPPQEEAGKRRAVGAGGAAGECAAPCAPAGTRAGGPARPDSRRPARCESLSSGMDV